MLVFCPFRECSGSARLDRLSLRKAILALTRAPFGLLVSSPRPGRHQPQHHPLLRQHKGHTCRTRLSKYAGTPPPCLAPSQARWAFARMDRPVPEGPQLH